MLPLQQIVLTKTHFDRHKESFRERMISHLNPTSKWTYYVFPENIPEEERQLRKEKMRSFLYSTQFDNFFDEASNILSQFTKEDCDSIGTGKETQNTVLYLSLFKNLEDTYGFLGVENRQLNFWSGELGKLRAHSQSHIECSDSDIPSISAMFSICGMIQDIELKTGDEHLFRIFPEAISKCYALQAQGDVNVYISSDKVSESAGFTVGNNFWEAELNILQKLRAQGRVSSINIHLYDSRKKEWLPAVNINSIDVEKLPLVRRIPYTANPLADLAPERYFNLAQSSYDAWRLSKPRQSITFGKLKNIFVKWHQTAKVMSTERPLIVVFDLDLTMVVSQHDLQKGWLANTQNIGTKPCKVRYGLEDNYPFYILNPRELSEFINFILSAPQNGIMIMTAGAWSEEIRTILMTELQLDDEHKKTAVKTCLFHSIETDAALFTQRELAEFQKKYYLQEERPLSAEKILERVPKDIRIARVIEYRQLKGNQFLLLDDSLTHIKAVTEMSTILGHRYKISAVEACTRVESQSSDLRFFAQARNKIKIMTESVNVTENVTPHVIPS